MPRAGLGNKLLVWARAYVFAQQQELPLYLSPWEQLKIGHIIRRERDPRFYTHYFKHGHRVAFFYYYWRSHYADRTINPELHKVSHEAGGTGRVYVFQWRVDEDFFYELKPYRNLIQHGLWEMTLPYHKQIVSNSPTPCIGMHIRRGDFAELKKYQDFNTAHLARTPLSYFEEMIHRLRSVTQYPTPVSLFSDARPEELDILLRLPNVQYVATNSAIADMLLLSKSKVIVLSADSTFGLFAAFLSDAAVILHPKNKQYPTRSTEVNQHHFEGSILDSDGVMPKLLIRNLNDMTCLDK